MLAVARKDMLSGDLTILYNFFLLNIVAKRCCKVSTIDSMNLYRNCPFPQILFDA